MSKVWTPLKKPPDPASVHLLSDDARLVLAALREAHVKRLENQERSYRQARDGRSYYHQIYTASFKTEQDDERTSSLSDTQIVPTASQAAANIQSGEVNTGNTGPSEKITMELSAVSGVEMPQGVLQSPDPSHCSKGDETAMGSCLTRGISYAPPPMVCALDNPQMCQANEEIDPWLDQEERGKSASDDLADSKVLHHPSSVSGNMPLRNPASQSSCFEDRSNTLTGHPASESCAKGDSCTVLDVLNSSSLNAITGSLNTRSGGRMLHTAVNEQSTDCPSVGEFGHVQVTSHDLSSAERTEELPECVKLDFALNTSPVRPNTDHLNRVKRHCTAGSNVDSGKRKSSGDNLRDQKVLSSSSSSSSLSFSSSSDVKQAVIEMSPRGIGAQDGSCHAAEKPSPVKRSSPDKAATSMKKLFPVFLSKMPGQNNKAQRKGGGSLQVDLEKVTRSSSSGSCRGRFHPDPTQDRRKSVTAMSPSCLAELQETVAGAELILLALLYADGSSQLRECEDLSNKRKTVSSFHMDGDASTILVDIQSQGKTRTKCSHVMFPLAYCRNETVPEHIKKMLVGLLECRVQKVCFDAQELLQSIIINYKLDPQAGCNKWEILDPKVAGWLLDPDKPPVTFSQLIEGHLDGRHTLTPLHNQDTRSKHGEDLGLLGPVMEDLALKLKKDNLWELFINIEVKLIPILAAMEVQGVKIDSETLQRYGRILKDHIVDAEKTCFEAAGHPFQINSHVQLRQILFDELKLDEKCPGQKLARTNVQNLKSTSESVLQKLKDVHPLPGSVLNYRQLVKLKSTYIDGLWDCISGGYIHTSWEQTSAASGRLQSSNPNIQNIPKQPVVLQERDKKSKGSDVDGVSETSTTLWMREPFISKEGWTFIAADFQSIELRILAHMSRDPVLLKVFNEQGGTDIFVQLTCEWLGMEPQDVTSSDRERTKRIVYSVVYGAGSDRLAETLNVSKENAKSFMKSFLGKFQGIGSFSHRCICECQRHGRVRTIFNRHRLITNINSHNFQVRAHAERQAVNFVVQGSAADICKLAMIHTLGELSQRTGLRARLLVQIHDELLFEVHSGDVAEVKELLKSAMESTVQTCGLSVHLKVPLPVSLSVGKTWGRLQPA